MSAITAPGPALPAAPTVEARRSHGLWGDALRRLVRNGPALLGMFCIALFVSAAVFAPVIAPFDPTAGNLADKFLPPGTGGHIFGTDLQGRDIFSRVIYGARISLVVGVGAVSVGLIIGGTWGAIAGALGGRADSAMMRVVDAFLAIPGILLAIAIVAWLGQGLPQVMLAVAVANAPIFARLLRGSMLSIRESDFVTAARSVGVPGSRLLLRHMLPNALTPLIVAATLALATAIIDVAGLGYLGLGPADPRTPEWGTMLTDASAYIRTAAWVVFFPGVAIVISAIGFNLLGDGLRESLDPRLKR